MHTRMPTQAVEWMDSFALRLPMIVALELVGFPVDDHRQALIHRPAGLLLHVAWRITSAWPCGSLVHMAWRVTSAYGLAGH